MLPRYLIYVPGNDTPVATAMHRRQAKRIARGLGLREYRITKPVWLFIYI